MKKSIIAACISQVISAGILSSHAVADEYPDFEAYLGATHYLWDNDRGLDDATGLDLGAELPMTGALSLDAWVSKVDADPKSGGDELEGMKYSLGGLYHFDNEDAAEDSVRPFASFGFAHQEFDVASDSHNEGLVYIGAGLKKYFDNNLIVRGDILAMNSLDNEVTDMGLRLAAGYAFGRNVSKPVEMEEPVGQMKQKMAEPVQPAVEKVAEKVEEKKEEVVATVMPPKDSDMDGVADANDKCAGTDKAFKVDATGCPIMLAEKVSIKMEVKFPTNSAVVTKDNYDEIAEVADFMKQFDKTVVTVEGYTDDRGRAAYNKSLSQKRADAVRTTLIEKFGLDASRVKAIGYGEENPIADNATAEGRAANRRVIGVVESSIEKPATK